MRFVAAFCLVVCCVCAAVQADECDVLQPNWVFCDDFENGIDPAWDPNNVSVTTTPSEVYRGTASLKITSHKSVDNGGGLMLDIPLPQDTMFIRFFTKFSANFGYLHHFVHLAGRDPGLPVWYPFGSAGCKPTGSDFFGVGLEPDGGFAGGTVPSQPIPGRWFFYTYCPDMTGWTPSGGYCSGCSRCTPSTPGCEQCFHGNGFWPASDNVPPLNQWLCMEMKVQMNTPGQNNGSQTMWANGTQLGSWNNLRYRDVNSLKVNSLLLQHYTSRENPQLYVSGQSEQTVWFDNVVLSSTGPIGCTINTGGSSGSDSGPIGPPPSDPVGGDSLSSGDTSTPPGSDSVAASGGDAILGGDSRTDNAASFSGTFHCTATPPAFWAGLLGLIKVWRRRR